MKSKVSRIPKDLRAPRDFIYGRRFANFTSFNAVGQRTLPNATPLTPEERVSINEFFSPTSNEAVPCEEKGSEVLFWG